MSSRISQARLAVKKARAALRSNDRGQARLWAQHAAQLAPEMEDPWLILAAVASPRASLDYIRRALKLNPSSPRARRGMEWATRRLRRAGRTMPETQQTSLVRTRARRATRSLLIPLGLLVLGCVVFAAAVWLATASPVVASMLPQQILVPQPLHAPAWALAPISNPTHAPVHPLVSTVVAATPTPQVVQPSETRQSDLSTPFSTDKPADLSTDQPTAVTAEQPTAASEVGSDPPTVEPTWSGLFSLEIVADTPTPEVPAQVVATTSVVPGATLGVQEGEHWIDVNLSQQMVYAYVGDAVVNSFLASTGTSMTPTVTGQYHIYVKLRYTDMTGPDYYLPAVPYTMYFYKDYGLHGTYWHHNFGTPMSHGCVNLSIPDAEWLYDFASVGTLVDVHY